MTLTNKLNLDSEIELARVEEKISKQKAISLWQSGDLNKFRAEIFKKLTYIHKKLFEDVYYFAGTVRNENDFEIKTLLASALTDKIDDRELFIKGLDASYFYENYFAYKSADLARD